MNTLEAEPIDVVVVVVVGRQQQVRSIVIILTRHALTNASQRTFEAIERMAFALFDSSACRRSDCVEHGSTRHRHAFESSNKSVRSFQFATFGGSLNFVVISFGFSNALFRNGPMNWSIVLSMRSSAGSQPSRAFSGGGPGHYYSI